MQRWITFMSVGLLGIVVQLSALAVLSGGFGLNYLLATGLAVEAAVLHNFIWHETWTWSDRLRGETAGVWKRLARFHLANGALSIAGNIVLMQVFVGVLALNATLANALAIALCSILNFLAADRLVFQGKGLPMVRCEFRDRSFRPRWWPLGRRQVGHNVPHACLRLHP